MINSNFKDGICVFTNELGEACFFPVNNNEVEVSIFNWTEVVREESNIDFKLIEARPLIGFSFAYKFKNKLASNGVIHVMNPVKNTGKHRFYNSYEELDKEYNKVLQIVKKRIGYKLIYSGFQNFG